MMPDKRHVIRNMPDGKWSLLTWLGYPLKSFDTEAEAKAYYEWHCPDDIKRGLRE